jgi:hypothetical protein
MIGPFLIEQSSSSVIDGRVFGLVYEGTLERILILVMMGIDIR